MSKIIDNSPSAFPSHGSMGERVESGMTLRDYFAAKVLQGAIAYPNASLKAYKILEYASFSYAMADAMLAERNKGG